jgi:hypothetical protein
MRRAINGDGPRKAANSPPKPKILNSQVGISIFHTKDFLLWNPDKALTTYNFITGDSEHQKFEGEYLVRENENDRCIRYTA